MLRCCLRAASTAPRSQVPRPKVQPDKTPKPSRSPRVPVSPQGQLVFHRPSGTLYSLQSPEDEQQLLARSRTEVPITPRTDKVTFAQTTWTPASLRLNELPAIYASLVKARLTGLVVISGLAGYCMCPGPVVPGVLLAFTGGTALLSASANSLNQWLEIPYDSQMKRTLGRPLVRGVISPIHALTVSGVTPSFSSRV